VNPRSGQSLLHFRLGEKLGEGGMGEVFRAVDTTLDREVAIKFLPEAFAGDRERVARLEREAKLLASLNHPNIAAIYGFPEADAAEAGGGKVRFLAMELVRGEDLAEVLARGPMVVREVIDAARQIAAALEAAHENGIIHRDLKPANIKRTPGGQIKVLDFGLAKAFEAGGMTSGKSATVTSAGSTAGLIVGTASYMSPEQARGQLVDRRTDLWAFACVLYEMLTGVKAFDGATVTDVLAAVVTGEPDWSKLPAATPPAVRRLLRRCFEKDLRKRLRDAGDAGLLLDDNPEDSKAAPAEAAASKRSGFFPILGLALALAGIAAGLWIAHGGPAAPVAASLELHRLTYARGMLRAARFAADGRTIVYGAAWGGPPVKLHMARIESPESAPIPLPPAELMAISKSGELAIALDFAYYGWMADGTLARSSLLGGAPREILGGVRAADWSPDEGQMAVVHRAENLDQLEYPIGTVLDRTSGYFGDVRIAPDGESVAYTDHPSWGDNRGGISVVDRNGAKTRLVKDFAAIQGVAWAPGGKEIWYTGTKGDQGSTLYAVDLSGNSRVVYTSIGSIELFDIAADGRVLLGSHKVEREVLAFLNGYTEPRALYVSGEASISRGVTSDGNAVLVSSHDTKDYETFVVRSDRAGAVKLTSGDAAGISPDRTLAMTSSSDYRTLFLTPLGMGPTRAIPNPDRIEYWTIAQWLPDGKRFLVVGRQGDRPSRAFLIDVETGAGSPFGPEGVTWPVFAGCPVSPDGKLAVMLDPTGSPKQWPLAGGEPIPIPGLRPGEEPLTYTEDGKALFVAGRSVPIEIERLELGTGRRSPWTSVAPTDRAGLRYTLVTISPNGKYWAMSIAKLLTDLYVVEGLR